MVKLLLGLSATPPWFYVNSVSHGLLLEPLAYVNIFQTREIRYAETIIPAT
jgi:hypothetical protein